MFFFNQQAILQSNTLDLIQLEALHIWLPWLFHLNQGYFFFQMKGHPQLAILLQAHHLNRRRLLLQNFDNHELIIGRMIYLHKNY